MHERQIKRPLLAALQDTPVVFLGGARQTGKSTLARQLVSEGHFDDYVTFDDLTALHAATNDPAGFVAALRGRLVLDEIQRVPEIFLPLKAAVDRNRAPGRFLLTGSARVDVIPQVADALVGRMELHTLRPLSQAEMAGRPGTFLQRAFAPSRPKWQVAAIDRQTLSSSIS